MPESKPSKKQKRPDRRPARLRYREEGRLMAHKVRNLVRHSGYTLKEAMGGRRLKLCKTCYKSHTLYSLLVWADAAEWRRTRKRGR